MINAGVDKSLDFESVFKKSTLSPQAEMERAITVEYRMNRKHSGVVQAAADIRAAIDMFLKSNTGFDYGRLTLIQLDKLITTLTKGLVTHQTLLSLEEIPTYVLALILIDGVLKAYNIEVHGGYQNARLSYISADTLQTYYGCLDGSRYLHSKRELSAVNNAVAKFYELKTANY